MTDFETTLLIVTIVTIAFNLYLFLRGNNLGSTMLSATGAVMCAFFAAIADGGGVSREAGLVSVPVFALFAVLFIIGCFCKSPWTKDEQEEETTEA